MIVLSRSSYDAIITHAKQQAPNEACGLLAGYVDGMAKTIYKVYFMNNIDGSPIHFSMDVKEQFAAVADIRRHGWALLGNFHSHPATPSRPSEEDKRLAYDSTAVYMIVSLASSQPVVKSFHIENGNVTEEKIEIREEHNNG